MQFLRIKVTKSCLQLSHLNVPVPVPHVVEAQLVSDLRWVHGLGQVLLVGKDQHHSIPQLVLRQHPVQLVPGLSYPLPVIAVHHEYQSISVLKYEKLSQYGNIYIFLQQLKTLLVK